jgi:hypothetical protein
MTTNSNEIQKISRKYFENLYSNKLQNLEETDKYLDIYDQTKLNPKDINHLNGSTTSNGIKAVIKNLPKKEKPRM